MAARALTSWTWVILAFIALAVHGQAIVFGWTGLDDRTLIEDARPVLARGSVVTAAFTEDVFHETDPALRFYYRPLLTLSFAADEALHGGEPGPATPRTSFSTPGPSSSCASLSTDQIASLLRAHMADISGLADEVSARLFIIE